MTRRLVAVASLAAAVAGTTASMAAAQRPPAPDVDALVARAGEYVAQFVARFSNVVAEERYVQEVTYPPTAGIVARGAPVLQQRVSERRELKSDFLLVRSNPQSDYLIFRDVFEVDGRQVRDREQRLTKLFLESSPTAMDQASRVALESARYNLAGQANTINTPLVALAFLQEKFQSRFHFSLGKSDKDVGPGVWVVEFEDRSRPTLVRGPYDTNLVSRGHLWIDADTGRVLKSDLSVGGSRIVVSFRFDEVFQIAVPFEMQEWGQVRGGALTGNATYGRFRRFQITSDEKIQQ